MQLTDVLDMMPQARRDQWHKSISENTCPEFEEQAVRNTLAALMASRAKFLSERVDGIFRGLSGEHVTNRPEGFGRRMIIAHVLREYGFPDHSRVGLINDLRCVVAKLMRRDEPRHNASDGLIRALKDQWGEWVNVDGGAIRIRLYRKGTAHLEIHPDMAWRLNSILAHLYPRAIPAQFRERPKWQPHDVTLIQRPLPFAVVHVLAELEQAYTLEESNTWRGRQRTPIKNALRLRFTAREAGSHVLREAKAILESVGGSQLDDVWHFDYPPQGIINQICASGCIPDNKAHQFYPTPTLVAEAAVRHAAIESQHICLEPSAGLGGLAEHMPKNTTCVEVSKLRAEVLTAKGFAAECADFLSWATSQLGRTFDRIVMNPPFDAGRWRAHLDAAAALLAPGGRLVAVLPSSAKDKDLLPGFSVGFPEVFDNAFAGTSVSVVLFVANRPC